MKRSRIIFIAIVGIAIVIVAAALLLRSSGREQPLVVVPKGPIQVRILTALPVEPWVRAAAEQFNQEDHRLDGERIQVEILATDGLTALGKFDRDEFGALASGVDPADLSAEQQAAMERFPTAWIPDSRYLPELANAAYKERLGRDVFLTDGEYRTRPLALSLSTWGIYQSRADVLDQKFGEVDWQVIHDAAISKGGWPELGGEPGWGFFKLVVPDPRKNVGGLTAMISAAGEYYGRPNISTEDVADPAFQAWLGELLGATTDLSGASAYTAEDFALFGYSVGDGGLLLESDLLNNMQGIENRWGEPLSIRYPEYVTWFDFPMSIWIGPETSALQKNAALEFERYLLSPEVQQQAIAYGLRPVSSDVAVDSVADSPFVQWEAQGVAPVVPRTAAMRSPDRDVLQTLLRWFELNVAR
ncbi:MAG: substrate-binding domain-containing protein [Caldilineales bacterium]|nr:substrate-binding domain-containing protein [Caldilineales bacterium]